MTVMEEKYSLVMSKKQHRIEAKKRKIKAFLRLTTQADSDSDTTESGNLKRNRKTTPVADNSTSTSSSSDSSDNEHIKGQKRRKTAEKLAKIGNSDIVVSTESSTANQSKVIDSDITSEKKETRNGLPQMSHVVTDAELDVLRLKLREKNKKKQWKKKPTLAWSFGYDPGDGLVGTSNPKPLFVHDLQHLFLSAVQGPLNQHRPRWCELSNHINVSQIMVIVAEDAGATDFLENKDSFPFLASFSKLVAQMITPAEYGSSVEEELFCMQKDNPEVVSNAARSINVRDLLLSHRQMIQEEYPLPINTDLYRDFQFSQEEYRPVSASSPVYSIDCEMCLTSTRKYELTRISVVDEQLDVIYESLVKPYNMITDYLTRYSGITEEKLKDVTTRLEDVQQALRKLLPSDAIWCGQSLNNDLLALKLFHPYVIDTSVIYNLSWSRSSKTGLKKLISFFFGETIQGDAGGHDPTEDARAAMKLVKLKLKQGLEFGDNPLSTYFTMIEEKRKTQTTGSGECSQMCNKCGPSQISSDYQMTSTLTSESCDLPKNQPSDQIGTECSAANISSVKTNHTNSCECPVAAKPQNTFFTVLQDFRKSAVVIHLPTALVWDNMQRTDMERCECHSDKDVRKKIKASTDKYFIYTRLPVTYDSKEEDKKSKKDEMLKMDKRIKKILKHVKDNALVAVLFTGKVCSQHVDNALCCLAIT